MSVNLSDFIMFWVVIAVMTSAALHDHRTREVPDIHWSVLCVASVVIMLPDSPSASAGMALLSLYMLSPKVVGARAAVVLGTSLCMFATACVLDPGSASVYLGIPAMFLLSLAFYASGLLKGGADAKACMALSMAVPAYPGFQLLWQPVYPEAYLMPPSMAVLLTALAASLAPMVPILVRNIASGYRGRGMATTYVLPLEVATRSHVWILDDAVDGRLVTTGPSDDAERPSRLRAAGVDRVRVTPMIPFLVPLSLSTAIVLFLGNPFMTLFG